ncbi:MAG: AmmeMemoRadiSam system protein A [Nitrospirae bacterium]|nr:AmmeMemoRadiSam system protein A [Nitrospirota bacterium]
MPKDKNGRHPLVQLAAESVGTFLKEHRLPHPPETLSPEMAAQAGVFVCLKKDGELRGCIGTFMPAHGNVAEEIIHNAVSAATEDPRFDCVGCDELDGIDFSVDVLSPPEPVKSLSELDPKRYGVIVMSGNRRGLLLPDLEGVDTVDYQIAIAKRKAGIDPTEPVQLFRFEVKRYE